VLLTCADSSAGPQASGPDLPDPPGQPEESNEPEGYTRVAERAFSAFSEDGWDIEGGTNNVRIVSDSTAPKSPRSVMRVEYAAGYRAGTGPVQMEKSISANRHTGLYASVWLRLSPNFEGNESGTNKLIFHWIHNNPSVFLSAEGVGSGKLEPTIRLQNVSDSREYLYPNVVPGAELTRGQWHRWEYQFVANEPGSGDGVARWWLDGTLIGEYEDILFSDSGQSNHWEYYQLSPIWGGVNGAVQETMHVFLDHIYVSGAS
jgi:hypothetical protein